MLSVLLTWFSAVLVLSSSAAVDSSYFNDYYDNVVKKSECMSMSGKCFNMQQCCAGLTCASVDTDAGDSLVSPGRCVKNKELRPCSSAADCGPQAVCAAATQSDGQRYCLPTEDTPSPGRLLANRLPVTSQQSASGPRKHQAYSRVLSPLGGPCDSNQDCQPFSADDPDTRLCCQQVRRGRQGAKRICDRVTPISVCYPPLKN